MPVCLVTDVAVCLPQVLCVNEALKMGKGKIGEFELHLHIDLIAQPFSQTGTGANS